MRRATSATSAVDERKDEKGSRRYCPRSTRKERKNATSDFKASADITNAKKVRRLAAVCSSFASTAFQCFLPDWRFSKAIPWKIVEKGTLKPGSSPPRAEEKISRTTKDHAWVASVWKSAA